MITKRIGYESRIVSVVIHTIMEENDREHAAYGQSITRVGQAKRCMKPPMMAIVFVIVLSS